MGTSRIDSDLGVQELDEVDWRQGVDQVLEVLFE